MTTQEILKTLRSLSNPANVAGMARYGISSKDALGVSMPALRALGRRIGRDHKLALELWDSRIHEARILAALVDVPGEVTVRQMNAWAADLDSWDVCDQVVSILFDKTPYAVAKAFEWSGRKQEFVKRAGFVLMAALAVHDKALPDRVFVKFLSVIKRESGDERNFVKKAVNWALRQIGKRNASLNKAAVKAAGDIRKIDSKSARWISADALRELTSDKVAKRLK